MGDNTLGISEGRKRISACLDGSSHHLCAHWELAHEETTGEDADLGLSKTDHATRLLLSHSPAVSKVRKSPQSLILAVTSGPHSLHLSPHY
jgi:hypothetical protein